MNRSVVVLGLLATGMAMACGGGPEAVSRAGEGSGPAPSLAPHAGSGALPSLGRAEVTLQPGARIVDRSMAAGIVGVSDDGTVYRLGSGAGAWRDVATGQVLLIADRGIRRVEAVRPAPGGTELVTAPADLSEAVRDGEIAWAFDVDWSRPAVGAGLTTGPVVHAGLFPWSGWRAQTPPAFMGDRYKFVGKVKGWDVHAEFVPKGKRLEVLLRASLTTAGTRNIAVRGSGWISGFTQEALLTYQAGSPTRLTVTMAGLEGEMDLEWRAFMVANQRIAGDHWVDVPISIPFRFMAGPVPMQANVVAKIQIAPTFLADESSSGGHFRIRYRSDQGVSYSGAAAEALGRLVQGDISVAGETVTAGMMSATFATGFEFPRIEIGPLGHPAMAFVTLKTFASSTWIRGTILTNDVKTCQRGNAAVLAAAGYKVKAFNLALAEGQKEIWRKEIVKYLDDEKCD